MSHIAFVLPNFAGGGAERVALTLIQELLKRGHTMDLVLASKTGELLQLLPPEVRVIDLRASRLRKVLRPLARYLRESQPDGVQVSMWPLTALAVVAHRLAGSRARLVLSDHGNLSRQYGGSAASMAALRASIRFIYPLADARIAVSQGMAADLATLSGLGRESLSVIHNPITGPRSMPEPTPEIEALWTGGKRRIITVGNLKPVKNHALLMRAFAMLKDDSARLMILGEGELRPQLERLSRELGVLDKVVMPGFATDPWPYYASAHLFVLSSDSEGLPLAPIEALIAGLPVVSTDCPHGPSEILEGGRYGTLVPCGDPAALEKAMREALDKPANSQRQRGRGAEFSVETAADAYSKLMCV